MKLFFFFEFICSFGDSLSVDFCIFISDLESEAAGAGETVALSAAQRARIERNRQKALLLRQARLASQPYTRDGSVLLLCQIICWYRAL